MIGSPGYMSPEQLKSSKTVDSRGDIWSLGVVMYELATGQKPFEGDSITELALKVTMDPTPPMRGNVPPGFEAVVRRCLEKDAARRYQDVADLAAALAPFVGARGFELAQGVARVRRGTNIPFVPVISTGASTPTTLRGANGVISERAEPSRSWRLPGHYRYRRRVWRGSRDPAGPRQEEHARGRVGSDGGDDDDDACGAHGAATDRTDRTDRADRADRAYRRDQAGFESRSGGRTSEGRSGAAGGGEVASREDRCCEGGTKAEVARHKAEKAEAAKAEIARHKAEKAEAAKAKTAVKKKTETKPPKAEDLGDSRF